MNQLAPPGNEAGVTLPPNPAINVTLDDITNAIKYIDRLSLSKWAAYPDGANGATDAEIGAAEAYKTAVIFAQNPVGGVAPAWLANLNAMVQQLVATAQDTNIRIQNLDARIQESDARIQNLDVTLQDMRAEMQRQSWELPILLANNKAGNHERLLNPTVPLIGGVAPPQVMAAPNPASREALVHFTALECSECATSLGLPALPADSTVEDRRLQIANRIGVTL